MTDGPVPEGSALTALDTNVILASQLVWHDHHRDAFGAVAVLRRTNTPIALPVPALIESYSVMTRLPSPNRVKPADALSLLEKLANRVDRISGLPAADTLPFLRYLADEEVQGGATYDALIVACAQRAGAGRILTFNVRDFERLAPPEMSVVAPRAPSNE